MQNKRIYVPELKRWVRLKISTRALRSINRVGLLSDLRAAGKTLGGRNVAAGAGVPISSAAAGSLLDTSRERISVRRILAYAAGIGATGSPAFDDDREGGVVAMPPWCVSLEWPVVSGAGRSLVSARPAGAHRGVHAAQDSTFHRPIRPGDESDARPDRVGRAHTRGRPGAMSS